MKKGLLVLSILSLFVVAAPSYAVCVGCTGPADCTIDAGNARRCWFGIDTCHETGACTGLAAAPADLASELTVARVEVQQGETVTVTTPQAAPTAVAEVRPVPAR
ncbi:MAG TPA: hypothetical protein VGF69_15725 [Thermoanaerobaculia bacterium]|jgi:hypothetical protein